MRLRTIRKISKKSLVIANEFEAGDQADEVNAAVIAVAESDEKIG